MLKTILLLVLIVLSAVVSRSAFAQPSPDIEKHGWDGVIGIGPVVFPKYAGGSHMEALPLPVLSINFEETFFVEIQRVGVYMLASDDKKTGLAFAAEPRLGWTAKDGARLTGMSSRKSSAETGLTFDWESAFATLSTGLFVDASQASRGASARMQVYKSFVKNSQMEIGVLLSVDRLSAKVANYYFGVHANEATTIRPYFAAPAANNIGIGLNATHKLSLKNSLIWGINISRLDKPLSRSPIVETRISTLVYCAYGWNL